MKQRKYARETPKICFLMRRRVLLIYTGGTLG
ncbi:MAG: hypothetical protein RLZZ335_966, partial [Bacteroidota bacterium]